MKLENDKRKELSNSNSYCNSDRKSYKGNNFKDAGALPNYTANHTRNKLKSKAVSMSELKYSNTSDRDYKAKYALPLSFSKKNDVGDKGNSNHTKENYFSTKYSNLLNLNQNSGIIKKIDEMAINNNTHNFTLDFTIAKEDQENHKKLKENIQIFSTNIRKNEGESVNTLFKIRTVLLNWLKDSENDNLEYNKFMTEKKIKYLMKNKEKLEFKIKTLENDLICIKSRKGKLESNLNEYISYDVEELEQEIERFENSYEIRSGKSKKMASMLMQKKEILPYLKEYHANKALENNKTKEKNEMEKICKNSLQTLGFLSNYYKNLRNKIKDISVCHDQNN